MYEFTVEPVTHILNCKRFRRKREIVINKYNYINLQHCNIMIFSIGNTALHLAVMLGKKGKVCNYGFNELSEKKNH